MNIELLIGHLLGDYIFQNDWMANRKHKPGYLGLKACLIHCTIYACMVTVVMIASNWQSKLEPAASSIVAFLIAFVTHFPIDRWSLGHKWMQVYGHSLEGPFVPCIYIGVDNGMHLLLMWILFSIL